MSWLVAGQLGECDAALEKEMMARTWFEELAWKELVVN